MSNTNVNGWQRGLGAGGKIESNQWDVIRTDFQVKAHEGFASEVITLKGERDVTSEGERTPQLAKPPHWSSQAACDGDHPSRKAGRTDAPFDEVSSTTRGEANTARAKAICASCPVRELCLEAAMEEEGSLSTKSRYTVRGGLTPKERFQMYRNRERAQTPRVLMNAGMDSQAVIDNRNSA